MKCTKCKKEKEQNEFEFRTDRNSYRTVCKECKNERSREKYEEIASKLSERRKEVRKLNKEEANRKARERYWKNREDFLAKARNRSGYGSSNPEAMNKWKEKNKHKCAAHQAVVRGVKNGKISKPDQCQVCGSGDKLNAHHHDYQKPLEVIWLCIPCHKKVHSKYFNSGGV